MANKEKNRTNKKDKNCGMMWWGEIKKHQKRRSFFFKQRTAYEVSACLVSSEMCMRDR